MATAKYLDGLENIGLDRRGFCYRDLDWPLNVRAFLILILPLAANEFES